jgi:hypothetical protein
MEDKVVKDKKDKPVKTWGKMTLEEKRAFYFEIFANPSGYANPDRPFYC